MMNDMMPAALRPVELSLQTVQGLTPRQSRVIKDLCFKILEHDGLDSENYEFKRVEIRSLAWKEGSATGSPVMLVTEVGRKNDENTYASVFARTIRMVAIGPRGGNLTLLNALGRDNKSVSRDVTFSEATYLRTK